MRHSPVAGGSRRHGKRRMDAMQLPLSVNCTRPARTLKVGAGRVKFPLNLEIFLTISARRMSNVDVAFSLNATVLERGMMMVEV